VARIAISGHRGLPDDVAVLIDTPIPAELERFPGHDLVGISCLADGADRLFVNAVLTVRGTFEVVLPVPEGPEPAGPDPELRELLDLASEITPIAAPGAPEAAYEAANREMLRRIEVLVAVWDGDAHGGRGGTSETVALARELGRTVHVVWPDGARRRAPQSPRVSSSASVLIAS